MESREVQIKSEDKYIGGTLFVPDNAKGMIVFAHGSGSSRFSPRNNFVAAELQKSNFATLLVDLLTSEEEAQDLITLEHRFDIEFLCQRLTDATKYAGLNSSTNHLPVAYFGSSTGAAAALMASAASNDTYAIVSRGGRPDMAQDYLSKINSAVLLIVGELDKEVISLNEQALRKMNSVKDKQLEIIPDASHLFEEPGALEEVVRLSKNWFNKHLPKSPAG